MATAATTAPAVPAASKEAGGERPMVPPGVPEVFVPTTTPRPLYRPWALGAAKVEFTDAKSGLDFAREAMFIAPVSDGAIPLRWEDAKWLGSIGVRDLASEPAPGARVREPAPALLSAKSYAAWSKKLVAWLASTQGVARWKSVSLKQYSAPNEDEGAFRARLAQVSREARDRAAVEVRSK
jgi:hypothetical protein